MHFRDVRKGTPERTNASHLVSWLTLSAEAWVHIFQLTYVLNRAHLF